jgi:hypothetical protein
VAITRLKKEMIEFDDYGKLADEKKNYIDNLFDEKEDMLRQETVIPVILEQIRHLKDVEAISLRNKIVEWAAEKESGGGGGSGDLDPKPRPKYISSRKIQVSYGKQTIENEQEIDQYVMALKEAWSKAIREGKRIQLT